MRRQTRRRRHSASGGERLGTLGKLLIAFGVAAVLLFIFAVCLGNYLGGLAENIGGVTTDGGGDYRIDFDAARAPTVIAKLISLIAPGEDGDPSTGEATDAAPETEEGTSDVTGDVSAEAKEVPEYNAYSVVFRDAYGRLCYTPTVAPGGVTPSVSVAELIETLGDTYLGGVFYVDYMTVEGELYTLEREYQLALICELLRAGADDILLCGYSEEQTDEAVAFAEAIRRRCPGAVLGIAFEADRYAYGATESLRKICTAYDFLALDASACADAESLSAALSPTGNMLDVFNIRLLVSASAGDEAVLAAMKYNENVQQIS